jgi:hypothetical protein
MKTQVLFGAAGRRPAAVCAGGDSTSASDEEQAALSSAKSLGDAAQIGDKPFEFR